MQRIAVWKLGSQRNQHALERILSDQTFQSIDKISTLIPGGAYTTFRTFNHEQILSLSEHINRLEESSQLAQKPIRIDKPNLLSNLRAAMDEVSNGDLRVRITLDLEEHPGDIYIAVEPLLTPPPKAYRNGVKVITHRLVRKNPKAKLTKHLLEANQIRNQLPGDINEVLAIADDDCILEGLSSNFFAVKSGELQTADDRVIRGTVRSIVLEEAENEGILVLYNCVRIDEIDTIDEAFITSTSRSILPIAEIDGVKIGSVTPGPITLQLMDCFQRHLNENLESL
jgi:branched-chain amino acid aminotransferase